MSIIPKILIVDDDPKMCVSLKTLLSDHGYELKTSSSVKEATECLDSDTFDLVLLDIVMGEENGFTVMDHIVSQKLDSLVVIITGHPSTDTAVDALRKGAYYFLKKPFEPEELLTTVKNTLNHRILKKQFLQAHKMESIASLARGIAHQFNNALSSITVNIDMLELDFPGEKKIAAYTKQMKDSANRMAILTNQLLAYARGGKYRARILSLRDFVRDTLLLIRHTVDPAIKIDTDITHDIFSIKADITQMQMVLSAILANASEAMEGKGHIRVTCRNEMITDETVKNFPGLKLGDFVRLTIEDNGKGMDEETRSLIFEPFFTTKLQGRGLSMAAVYGIIKNHDGWILVVSKLGKGTTVHIYLPAVESSVKEPKKPKIEPFRIKGHVTILVIEDEKMVMDVTTAILERFGYRVLGAKTGKEAIDIAKTFDGDIDLAILDIMLPDMNGKAIYPFLMEARPDLKVIVFSGYTIDGLAQEILNEGAQDFIQKPFTIAEILKKLKMVLEGK